MIVQESIKAKATQLLTPYRFDFMAKYIYADHRVRGIKSKWAENIYKEHLRVWNNFYEREPRKESFEDFKNAFDELIDSIGSKGYNADKGLIPISYNGSPLNGAHRISACMVHDKDLDCYLTNDPLAGQLDCSYYYFVTHRLNVKTGITIPISDPMALQYARLKPSCHIICFFSHTMQNEADIDKVIMNYGLPVYEKRLNLSEHGRINLMRQLYRGEDWLGDRSNYFHGARVKASRCFARGPSMRVMLFDPKSDADLVKMKDEIRQIFQVGKDSVHINDTQEETIRLSELFFNNNSLIATNNFHATDREKLCREVRALKRACRREGIDTDSICISGPGVLAAYGIHNFSEIQLISHEKSPEGFQNLNEIVDATNLDRTELVYDPSNYFYFEGVKVLCLHNEKEIQKEIDQNLKENLKRGKFQNSFAVLNSLRYDKTLRYRFSIGEELESSHSKSSLFCKGLTVNNIDKEKFNSTSNGYLEVYKEETFKDLNHEELELLDSYLNLNTIEFKSLSKKANFKKFEACLLKFKKWIDKEGLNSEDFCIDGSAVLSAFGIRDCADLDFLYSGISIDTRDKDIDCHNFHYQSLREELNLPISKNEIIFDSRHHFYYQGVKFCSIAILHDIKEKRLVDGKRQRKDDLDFISISSLLCKKEVV